MTAGWLTMFPPPVQVLRSDVRPGSGLRLPGAGAHDLAEEAGPPALALGALPQRPHRAGGGQPGGSVLHVATAGHHRAVFTTSLSDLCLNYILFFVPDFLTGKSNKHTDQYQNQQLKKH